MAGKDAFSHRAHRGHRVKMLASVFEFSLKKLRNENVSCFLCELGDLCGKRT